MAEGNSSVFRMSEKSSADAFQKPLNFSERDITPAQHVRNTILLSRFVDNEISRLKDTVKAGDAYFKRVSDLRVIFDSVNSELLPPSVRMQVLTAIQLGNVGKLEQAAKKWIEIEGYFERQAENLKRLGIIDDKTRELTKEMEESGVLSARADKMPKMPQPIEVPGTDVRQVRLADMDKPKTQFRASEPAFGTPRAL